MMEGSAGPKPTTVSERPKLPGGGWMSGKRITAAVPEPLVYALNPRYPGDLRAFYNEAIPLMRDDLIQAMREAGVDNLEIFRAVLKDPFAKKDLTNYKSVNIVGVVSCADAAKSARMGTSDSNLVDADYAALNIDENKAGGLLCFRLAEAVNAVVVHAKVKQSIEAKNLPGVEFFGPGEWSG
ncbi:MAG TPA: hypothetical protein VHM90_13955 [Phycisphaerae bacterium]|nr:hypothetical protein [Phycisphaerae bacterium]